MAENKNIENLKSMSLGDHLEELRKRLILALLGLIVGFAICIGFGKQLLYVINWPFEQASEKYVQQFINQPQDTSSSTAEEKTEEKLDSKEAKTKNAKSTGDSTGKKDTTNNKATKVKDVKTTKDVHKPKTEEITNADKTKTPLSVSDIPAKPKLYAHHPTEKVMVYFKTCILFGIIIASPWILYQIWAFVSAGLYNKEKRFVYRIIPVSTFLFVTGVLFFLLVIAPMVLRFLMEFNIGLAAVDQWRLREYVNMIITLCLVFGVAFQLPIVIVGANSLGMLPIKTLIEVRKYVILILFVLAAILTPPDIISQVSLAIPLYILFEASIAICWLLNRKKG